MGTVLINDVTKDDINAALIRIQKQIGSSGGSGNAQGTSQTIQNIQIQNSGGGSDLSSLYSMLSNMQKTIKEQGAKIEELEKSKTSLIQTTQQTVNNISDIQSILNSGITGDIIGVTFDSSTRIMSFNTSNGVFNVEVPDNEVLKKEIQVTNSNAGKYTKICSYSFPYTVPSGNPNADLSREDLSFSLMLYTSFRDYTAQGQTDPAQYDTISGTHIIMVGEKVESAGGQYHPGPADVSYSGATLKAYTFNGKGVIPDDAILIKDEWLPEDHGSYGTRLGKKYTIYLKNIQNGFKYSIVALSKGLWDFTTEEVNAVYYPTWTYADFGKMQPTINEVTVGNMQSVTSNAVAQAIGNIGNFKIIESSAKSFTFTANLGTSVSMTFTVPSGYKSICMCGWDISGASGAINLYATTSQEFYNRSGTFTENVWFRNYTGTQYTVTLKVFLLCLKQA